MINEILEDNLLLVIPNQIKEEVIKEVSKNNGIYDIKFMSLDQLIKKLTFEYDEKSIYFLMKNYGYDYDNARMYLNNLKYVTEEEYEDFRLDKLLKIKKELIDHDLLFFDLNFKKYLSTKKIIIYGYDYISNYDKKVLEQLSNVTIVSKKEDNYEHEVYEFNNITDEVVFVASKISDLIKKQVDINKIKLVGINSDYVNIVRRVFNFYNIGIDINEESSIISSNIVCSFFDKLNSGTKEEAINFILEKYNMMEENNNYIYEKIIMLLNKYYFVKEKDLLLDLLKHELQFISNKKDRLDNVIRCVNLFDNTFKDDDYVFLFGFNMGSFPVIYKNEEYLTDELKFKLGIEQSYELNKIVKSNIIKIIKSIKNLTISYKLKNDTDNFLPSLLIDLLGYKVIKNVKEKYIYSNIYNKINLASKIDNLIKYGNKEDDIDLLYSSYSNINYLTYDNTFTSIDKRTFKDSLNNKLLLSYSSIDNYNRCQFRYYLNNILKINDYEETFAIKIGTMFHDILSKAFEDNFDFEVEYESKVKEFEFNVKEKFFLKKLKEELLFVINTIKKHNTYNSLDKSLYENKIFIEKEGDISLTFMGIIDKIMYKEENGEVYLVIVDYKTSYPKINLNNTIYGIEMQLPIYLYLTKEKLFENAKVIGFYLQKIVNNEIAKVANKSYLEQKEDNLKLLGYTTSKEEDIVKFDDSYEDSKVIKSLKKSKNGFYQYSKIISEEEIEKLVKIVKKNIDKSFEDILEAKFEINPKRIGKVNYGCEFCKYKDVCYMKEEDIVNLKEYSNLDFLKDQDGDY